MLFQMTISRTLGLEALSESFIPLPSKLNRSSYFRDSIFRMKRAVSFCVNHALSHLEGFLHARYGHFPSLLALRKELQLLYGSLYSYKSGSESPLGLRVERTARMTTRMRTLIAGTEPYARKTTTVPSRQLRSGPEQSCTRTLSIRPRYYAPQLTMTKHL